MLTKEAVDALALAKALAIIEARNAVADTTDMLVALPQDFAVHDLEKFNPYRRRTRGAMSTTSPVDFAHYVKAHAEEGALIFVDTDKMHAVAVLNLGHPDKPGHADNTATLKAEPTAAFAALRAVAQHSALSIPRPISQREFAEFLEDWGAQLQCLSAEGSHIELKHAVDAVRRVTIEAGRKVESAEGKLSAEKTAFESVKARSDAGEILATLVFTCSPYKALADRAFSVRVSVRTGGTAPEFVLRIAKAEEHAEEMAQEFAEVIADAMSDGPSVLLGAYSPKA